VASIRACRQLISIKIPGQVVATVSSKRIVSIVTSVHETILGKQTAPLSDVIWVRIDILSNNRGWNLASVSQIGVAFALDVGAISGLYSLELR